MPFTPQQEQVLALISAGSSISQAAQSAGIHRNTIHNWVRSALSFRLAIAEARQAKALFWREQAEELAAAALETIRAIMTDPRAPASVRLKAAQSILNLATTPLSQSVHNSAQSMPQVEPAQPLPVTPMVHNPAQPIRRTTVKTGRNDLCPCGSGKKFKRCCLNRPAPGPPTAQEAA